MDGDRLRVIPGANGPFGGGRALCEVGASSNLERSDAGVAEDHGCVEADGVRFTKILVFVSSV